MGAAADPETLDLLAEKVAAALTRAGLTARVCDRVSEEFPTGGAAVWAEAFGDAGDGVFVTWKQHPSVETLVRRAVESMDLTDPALPVAAANLEAMRRALLAILQAASFKVSDASDINGAQAVVRP
jgi:hypothetical protein